MDVPIKKIAKKFIKAKYIIELTNLVRHNCSLNDKIYKQIDVELTVQTMSFTKINYMKTTEQNQLLRKWIIKLFNDKLSTTHVWH